MNRLLFIIPILICSISFAKENAKVIGSKVNIRKMASIDSPIITTVKKGAEIKIIEKSKEKIFINNYFGSWCKIFLPDGREGYIFDSFIKSTDKDAEKFHIFFKKFKREIINKRIKFIKKNITFPLKVESCFEAECKDITLSETDFNGSINIEEPYMYPIKFTYKNNLIKCWYGYEGIYYSLYFKLKNYNWSLIKVEVNSD